MRIVDIQQQSLLLRALVSSDDLLWEKCKLLNASGSDVRMDALQQLVYIVPALQTIVRSRSLKGNVTIGNSDPGNNNQCQTMQTGVSTENADNLRAVNFRYGRVS